MSSIGLTTLGMFDGPVTRGVGNIVIQKEETTIPKPNIFVKDVEFTESIHKKIKEEIIIEIKSVH
jgi:hypothetical protein